MLVYVPDTVLRTPVIFVWVNPHSQPLRREQDEDVAVQRSNSPGLTDEGGTY